MAYLVLRPVFDVESEKIEAYAVIYRDSAAKTAEGEEETAAKTINALFSTPTGVQILNDKPAYITLTEQLIKGNVVRLFDKNKLVVRIDDELTIQSALMDQIQSLRQEGYVMALNNFTFNARCLNMLNMVDMVILDIANLADEQLGNIVNICQSFNKKLMAEGVNTQADFERAKKYQFQLVQGNYFEDVQPIEVEATMDFSQSSFLRLAKVLMQEIPDVDEVANIIASDVSMSYKLLRLVNSVYFSMRNRVSTVKQAVVIMGSKQLRNWIYLLSFENIADDKTMEMIRLSFLRGAMCQALAKEIPAFNGQDDTCYMVGMFSTLEQLMRAPMDKILADLPLTDEAKEALIGFNGSIGKLLKLVVSYEQNKWIEVNELAEQLSLPINLIGRKYLECAEAVADTWGKLMQGGN